LFLNWSSIDSWGAFADLTFLFLFIGAVTASAWPLLGMTSLKRQTQMVEKSQLAR